jgi:phospholipase/lecithinase/hemolysin
MIRSIVFALTALFALTPCFSNIPAKRVAPFDHVIFFGDSLSDIGDMPMSPALIEPATKQIALNLYVPISNPIIPNGPDYTVPLTNIKLPYPVASPTPMPMMDSHGQIFPRLYHSLNWTQFFLTQAQREGLVSDQQPLVPWVWWRWYSRRVRSIDFAFAGATSQNNCRDFEYQHPNPFCTATSVFNAQRPYRLAGFTQIKAKANTVNGVQVPGLNKQVSFFIQAAKKHPGLATNNTLYIIFVGGNDLNLGLLNLTQHHYLATLTALFHGMQHNVSTAISTLEKQVGAQHIVVMNLFDMRLTPYLHTNIEKIQHMTPKQKRQLLALTHASVSLYNHELTTMVSHYNLLHQHILGQPVHVTYFDTTSAVNDLAKSPAFSNPATQYQMCLQTNMPASYYAKQNTCQLGDAKYLFWNGAHPSVYTGEYLGYALFQTLKADLSRQL